MNRINAKFGTESADNISRNGISEVKFPDALTNEINHLPITDVKDE